MNTTRTIRRRLARHGKENTQTALNNLLWKIVMQNGGQLNVPLEDLKTVPANAAWQATVDSATDNFVVVAGIRPSKSGLYLPPGAEN